LTANPSRTTAEEIELLKLRALSKQRELRLAVTRHMAMASHSIYSIESTRVPKSSKKLAIRGRPEARSPAQAQRDLYAYWQYEKHQTMVSAILAHQKTFLRWQRQNRETLRRVPLGITRFHLDKTREEAKVQREEDKQRLEALKVRSTLDCCFACSHALDSRSRPRLHCPRVEQRLFGIPRAGQAQQGRANEATARTDRQLPNANRCHRARYAPAERVRDAEHFDILIFILDLNFYFNLWRDHTRDQPRRPGGELLQDCTQHLGGDSRAAQDAQSKQAPQRLPAQGFAVAGVALQQQPQRHPGRRDGPWQDDPNHRPRCLFNGDQEVHWSLPYHCTENVRSLPLALHHIILVLLLF